MTATRTIPLRLFLAAAVLTCASPANADRLLDESVEFTGTFAFVSSGAPGLVIAGVRNGETAFAGFGETVRGSGIEPNADTMMRVASISKAFCGDALASLLVKGEIGLTDPVQTHLPDGFVVPEKDGRTLRIIDLATQTSGLPREMPQAGGTPNDPYAGHTKEAMIAAMHGEPFLFPPGTGALYSNLGFDLLGLAISGAAGKPYATVLEERVLRPRGMVDTVFNPRPGDEGRLMQGHNFDGTPLPFVPTPMTMECASGLYTTPNDMLKWITWHLAQGGSEDDARRIIDHASLVRRDGLSPALGLDDGGAPMDAMALGWVVVEADGNRPLVLHKSGGRQGMFTYVAIAPTRGVGVFAAINQFNAGGFEAMVHAVNELIYQLAPR
ncbi:D-alanyl-D-alanine-carboxypeptidase/endopeptidase AmpH [Mesorhizobium sp. M7A.F.Ca.US.001.04.1.1]|uniref:D-alanyl-D-alanine- carboxypeptidase/endopeptidase AmpH n=2 Tax=Mesorhizobium TaxID=68287 RepID=UPI000FCC8C57|nr:MULTISPECIES: D-alanyl-D-alanine-carboxypeptidase/endopeptidase AmpH [unclassified Mesorhizobium]RUY27054.1 D-alanyl-D-alanine-carboxypeptidase/endopeptidase AmpH [Mesorhizobium sp. M7A.F.Ca.US.001.04.2.1]RUY44039.1 D-alanyl-D-alanine-carboxypeptidase/endopeptidase AmpH [Mesorhizobium sp. M7A.F.Ca.US.001.04.1.1]